MTILDWFKQRRTGASASLPARRDASDDRWFGVSGDVAIGSSAGVMSYELAMQIPTVFACLNVISQSVAALPIAIFRRRDARLKERQDDHPLYATLHTRPNDYQTAFEFRQQMTWDAAFWRNAYAHIGDSERGRATVLTRLEPRRVTPRRVAGDISYEYRDESGRVETYSADRIMHLRLAPSSYDGARGLSVLETSSETLGQAFAVQRFAGQFFANFTASGERIIPPAGHRFADEESRMNWLRAYSAARSGVNRHKPALLLPDFKVEVDQVNNEQAQFIETRKEVAYDIARLWRMPPHKVGLLDKATFSNIEYQALEFVTDTLMPLLVAWEQCLTRDLIAEEGMFVIEHNVAGLLRGDIQSRYAAYAVGRQWGWMSVNEIRALENQNPVEGGDQYLRPLNMADAAAPMHDSAMSEPSAAGRPRQTKSRKANGHDRSAH